MVQWLGLGVAVLVLFSILTVNLYRDYQRTSEREQERLSTQARVIAENIEFQLSTINLILQRLIRDTTDSDSVLTLKEGAQSSYFSALIDATPGIRTIGILDIQGTMVASSRKELIGQDLSWREYVKVVKNRPDANILYVSPPFRSLLSPYIMNITRMVPGPDGELAGMVTITFDPEYLSMLMTSVLYTPAMWDMLVHADGQVFLTEPARSNAIGTSLARPGSLFARHTDSGQQATVLTGTEPVMDSAMQMVAQRTINPPKLTIDRPLVIAVGRDNSDIFSLWRSDLLSRAIFFVLTSGLGCVLVAAYQCAYYRFENETASSAANLRATQDNFQLIVENTADMVVKMDASGCFIYVNPAFCELFDATPEQLLGTHYQKEVAAAERKKLNEYFSRLFSPPYAVSFTQQESTVLGIRHLQWTAKALVDQHGSITEIIAIGRDLTEHMNQMGALEDQAHHDFLTGLANRRYFMNLGTEEVQRARRYGSSLSLLMLDIDNFKHINDTHGHKVGDQVLQAFSHIVQQTLRNIDIIGRVGGEEFVVLMPETPLADAIDAAHRLKNAVAAGQVQLERDNSLQITVSIGATSMWPGSGLESMLEAADAALYQAKQTGRNKVCVSEQPVFAGDH